MADLNFAEGTGNGCNARKFWNQHPDLCAAHDFKAGDGTWYIIGNDGERIQDVWKLVNGKWAAKPKPKGKANMGYSNG